MLKLFLITFCSGLTNVSVIAEVPTHAVNNYIKFHSSQTTKKESEEKAECFFSINIFLTLFLPKYFAVFCN